MTTATRNRLQDAYAARHAEVLAELAKLQAIVESMPSPDHECLNWGHVGDLAYARELVETANRHFESKD